jgi:uncharacterized membrane protein YphA (DoxX/SURF4 family)
MKINNKLLWISRIILGLVFIFSAFVKGVDPMGTMIKINEYLIVMDMEFFKALSIVLSIFLSGIEFFLGFCLILGLKFRISAWATLIMMFLFTIQTLILAIWNPVSDCGCFGDAIIMTNWQTFYKNIVLDIFVLIIFMGRNQVQSVFSGKKEYYAMGTVALFFILLSIYCYLYLPILDFRPYKVGNDIQELMTLPEDAEPDVYETILVYKNTKSGKRKEFDINNIPSDDGWEWEETINKLVKQGDRPQITDFAFSDQEGKDLTQKFLEEDSYKLMIVQEKLEASNQRGQKKLNALVDDIIESGEISIWALTSSLNHEIKEYKEKNQVKYDFYLADMVMLETIIRSNPGVLLLKNNKILKKWSSRNIPDFETLSSYMYQ